MPSQKQRIRNRKLKASLQNEMTADLNEYRHGSDSNDDDITKDCFFYSEMSFAENEIMKLYKDKFNIDPRTDKTYKIFTEEEQIERYAQNIAFWQNLLREYNEDGFDTRTSDPRYFYIEMTETEIRTNTF